MHVVGEDRSSEGDVEAATLGTTSSGVWSGRLGRIVSGEATSAEIESWVDASWRAGRFVEVVPRAVLDDLPTSGRPVARYGDSGILRSAVCFAHDHGPGGVVVYTPPMEDWSCDGATYCVAPHVHRNPHITVVLQGEAHFFIVSANGAQAHVAQVAVGPGHVLLCPADVAHTFGSKHGAFTVLSIQAHFVEPSEPDFARSVTAFDGLPVGRC